MYAMCVTVWSDHKVYFANWKNVRRGRLNRLNEFWNVDPPGLRCNHLSFVPAQVGMIAEGRRAWSGKVICRVFSK